MTTHTPGPWVLDDAENLFGCVYCDDATGSIVAKCSGFSFAPRPRAEITANARLIAAAPELLEACQTFAEWLRREDAGGHGQTWWERRGTPEGDAAWNEWFDENLRLCALAQEQARAAIAKATESQP